MRPWWLLQLYAPEEGFVQAAAPLARQDPTRRGQVNIYSCEVCAHFGMGLSCMFLSGRLLAICEFN